MKRPESFQSRPERSPQILRAVLRLRELILTGALAPGKRVPELELTGQTGVSRTPLRIAMERLAHEGLLEPRPRGGFTVRAFTRADIENAIEIRGVLEGTAARLSAERLTGPEAVEPLRHLARQLDGVLAALPALDAFGRYVELNEAFHDGLLDLGGNDMLRRLVRQVVALPFASPSAFVRMQSFTPGAREVLTIAQEHHWALVEAIGAREGGRAEHIAREHARLALRNLRMALEHRDRLRDVPGASLLAHG